MRRYTNQELDNVITAVINEGIFRKIFSNESVKDAKELEEKVNSLYREQNMGFVAKADRRVGIIGVVVYELSTRKPVLYINYHQDGQIFGYGVLGTDRYTGTANTIDDAVKHVMRGYSKMQQSQRKVAESRMMNGYEDELDETITRVIREYLY